MKSHRIPRKREKNNKRNKRRKKTLKKLKGGGLIEDTSKSKWLVCDNPYCWLNHYISDKKDKPHTARIFKYEKNLRMSGVESKYKDKEYFFLKIKEDTGYWNNNFTIVKEKSNTQDNFFYIGDCFSKIRQGKISSNPRYKLNDAQYENFDGSFEDRKAITLNMKDRDITVLSKSNYDDWQIEQIDEWEEILVRSILALLQTIIR